MKSRFLIDANLIRDMLSVTLLKALLSMGCEFYVISDILLELKNFVAPEVFCRIKNFNKLNIIDFEESLADEIFDFYTSLSGKLTYSEESIIFYAKKNKFAILSSDWNFLNIAKQYTPKVYNLLLVIEGMIRNGVLNFSQAAECLEEILKTNNCLPKKECEYALMKWKSGQKCRENGSSRFPTNRLLNIGYPNKAEESLR